MTGNKAETCSTDWTLIMKIELWMSNCSFNSFFNIFRTGPINLNLFLA